MREQTKKFIAYLNLLDVKIDSHSFADRIKAQKIAYILQKLTGKQLYDDFNFSINLRPYDMYFCKRIVNAKFPCLPKAFQAHQPFQYW